ncbi:zinc finger protein 385B-like isoform X2 [Polyodon spathula]|uniref:zinc finger protein 385B-like isoform X2 n=1 Tax=Polyodon spathula TaxID=7913 RepID=UPI001B7E2DC0|nr:zinc finger protein 385B-like isoform X2 [Polyodon spathula]
MKRPLSPDHILENGRMSTPFTNCIEHKLANNGHLDMQIAQDKKKLLYSLCEVCNIQLNTAAQAGVHYNGKSHLKRVKQLNNGKLPASTAPSSIFASTSTGSTCHSSTFPAAVRTPTLMMQPSLDSKPFMSFPMDTSSAVGLFPNFNTMDPVQKAVINHTFGVSSPPKKKQVISCNVCQLRFNSDVSTVFLLSQAEAHYKGTKHAKKLKAQESPKNKQKTASAKDTAKNIAASNNSDKPGKKVGPSNTAKAVPRPIAAPHPITAPPPITAPRPVTAPPPIAAPPFVAAPLLVHHVSKPAPEASAMTAAPAEAILSVMKNGDGPAPIESEEEKAKKLLYCSLCKVAVNSLSQLEAHNTGSKHKTMLEARNGAGPIKAYPRPASKLKVQTSIVKGSGLQNKTFHCEICDVHVNSEIQLKQHISSRRHKDRVAGKPMKPKYSPYNKQQRSSNVLAAKLAFQKDLVKPLTPTFLSPSFSPAAVSSLSLHPRPNTALFQTSALPASFFRAAPGPIRPTAGSILFAPY